MSHNEPDLSALTRDPQAAKLLGDAGALKDLLSAPETQTLMGLLNKSAGGSLQSAAQAAAAGRPDALMGLLDQVMKSQEGAQAVEGLQKKRKR